MEEVKKIRKNNGTLEDYDPEKFHEKVFFAVEGLKNVSASKIEMDAGLSIQNGITSKEIQKALTKACADDISEENHENQIAAARLLNQSLRGEVYEGWIPKPFLEMVNRNCEQGYYDGKYIFDNFTEDEIVEFGEMIDYNRDDKFVYSGLKKTIDSYLIKRYNKSQETPQEMFMLINMFTFAKYPKVERKKWIREGYKILSNFEVSLPTPIMIQLRAVFRKFISCNLIATGDSKETLANAAKIILNLVAAGAGLGIMPGDIRGLGADIDNGRMSHTGTLPIVKGYEKNTKAFVQPSRDGSSTNFYPFFHVEIEAIMTWGNAKGTEETRIRDMDHAIMFNKLFFRRYKNNQDITLFFMNDIPDINSYLGDDEEFTRRYEEAERTIPLSRQIKIPASKIFNTFIDERFLQSREYTTFMENAQEQGLYKIPLKMSNLCLEIFQPTMPIRGISIKRNIKFETKEDRVAFYELRTQAYFSQIDDNMIKVFKDEMRKYYNFVSDDINAVVDETIDYDYFDLDETVNLSEVGVCILAGINMGHCTDARLPIVSEYLVRLLEELIDYMEYDLPEVEKAAKMRRPLGIGFSDIFHLMAREKVFYNTREGRQFFHDRIELCAFYMTKTSIELAKERGPCQLITDTKYSDGIMPIDTYRKTVDELVDPNHNPFGLDWESLRVELKKYGMRHSTLMANAPYGSSSMVSNSTPGIEPPRNLANSKKGVTKLVPDIHKYGKYYTTVWSPEFNNIDYFKFVAVMQKWMDQATSANQYLDLISSGGKIKKSRLIEETLTARYYGLKTLYYSNIRSNRKKDGEEDSEQEEIELESEKEACASGGCEV